MSDTIPTTLEEEQIVSELLETVDRPRCEWQEEGETCTLVAGWAFVLTCAHVFLYCDEHMRLLDAATRRRPIVCSASGHPPKKRVTHRWERIV